MTTSILEALVQLFALFAAGRTPEGVALGRSHAARYMRNQLPKKWVDESLLRFDELVEQFQRLPAKGKEMQAKRLSKLSVKLLRTCNQINKGLERHEKHVVVVRLLEYLKEVPDVETGRLFLNTVADSFGMESEALEALQRLVSQSASDISPHDDALFVLDGTPMAHRFGGRMVGFHLVEENLFLLKSADEGNTRVNHQELAPGIVALLAPGGAFRDSHGSSLFHSELVRLLKSAEDKHPLTLRVEDVSHYFSFPKRQALHQFNLEAKGGQLVGIMGGSGSGKSTMLGVLNGSVKPTFGRVTINGIDVHDPVAKTAGLIGHVPQDDVLLAELTVRENLAFNAKLSLGNHTEEEQRARVDEVLNQLGLWEIQHHKVGSVLEKVISGGQRKRLNIGLELLRRPTVLFLDEPTSGLSSRDSEQIMDILKELTYAGQLVFAVLHQPSSDLFKMLDRLFMLDAGGHPIYWGNPLDAVRHFNAIASRISADQIECSACGNVNPEQLFDVVEAKTVDEYGRKTLVRKTSPKEWNDFYTIMIGNALPPASMQEPAPPSHAEVPGSLKQWRTFLERDVLAKVRNTQYLLVNAFEAPALALLLAGFMRFTQPGMEYTFRASENIPPFLFISVIVALFLGLSVSAEEILRDRLMLKRERFLRLNWHDYVHAKIAVVATVSVVHALGFVTVSHAVLDIQGMAWMHGVVFFAVAVFGNLLGLVISATFRSAKVIYIVIPLLVIPQIIFGGAIVRFERFNATFSEPDAVPWFGNLMASRWGFEALAVEMARNNGYDASFITLEDRLVRASWRRDYWLAAMKRAPEAVVQAELRSSAQELSIWEGKEYQWPFDSKESADWRMIKEVYNAHYGQAFTLRNEARASTTGLKERKNASHNEELWQWVSQDDRSERALILEDRIVQKSHPIHRYDPREGGMDATMYTPFKAVGQAVLSTWSYNLLALAAMGMLAWLILLIHPSLAKLQFASWISRKTPLPQA